MTQDEAFKAWWYTEGSQAPYTHHDCEEHTMRMCEIAWANGAYKALADHAMRETQRLGQEIEQEPGTLHIDRLNQWLDASLKAKAAQPEQEPVAWCSQFEHSCVQPPRRKPLTHDELSDIWFKQSTDWMEFARAIEAAHGIKENT